MKQNRITIFFFLWACPRSVIARYRNNLRYTRSRCSLQSLLRFAPQRISTAIAHAKQMRFYYYYYCFYLILLLLLFYFSFPSRLPLLWRGLGRGQKKNPSLFRLGFQRPEALAERAKQRRHLTRAKRTGVAY